MEEVPYTIEVSYPIKISDRDAIWVKVNALRSPSVHGYHNGSERMEMDDNMAEECANAINTLANKLREKGLMGEKKEEWLDTRQKAERPTDAKETGSTSGFGGNRTSSYPPSEKQLAYLERLRTIGVNHHDVAVKFLSEHGKISPGQLDKREASALIELLKDVKEEGE